MTLSEFLIKTHVPNDYLVRPRIVCMDGFSMSVQGSTGHYCSPRKTLTSYYSMEIGYPDILHKELCEYADGKKIKNNVFGYVPVLIIERIINKHGGIDKATTFKVK